MLDVGEELAVGLAGVSEFQRSFLPIGTITSLNSGFPSRETWTGGPERLP